MDPLHPLSACPHMPACPHAGVPAYARAHARVPACPCQCPMHVPACPCPHARARMPDVRMLMFFCLPPTHARAQTYTHARTHVCMHASMLARRTHARMHELTHQWGSPSSTHPGRCARTRTGGAGRRAAGLSAGAKARTTRGPCVRTCVCMRVCVNVCFGVSLQC